MVNDSSPGALDPNIDVTLGGKTYTLKPSFGALIRIERGLDAGLGALIMRFLRREYGAGDTARILYEGILAAEGNGAPSYEEIGRLVVREGVDQVAPAAIELIQAALAGFARFAAERADDAESSDDDALGDEPGDSEDPTEPRGTGSPGASSSAAPS